MESVQSILKQAAEEQASDLCRRIDQSCQLSPDDREEIVSLSRKFLDEFPKFLAARQSGKRGG